MEKLITQKQYCSHCKRFIVHYKDNYGWTCSIWKTYYKEIATG